MLPGTSVIKQYSVQASFGNASRPGAYPPRSLASELEQTIRVRQTRPQCFAQRDACRPELPVQLPAKYRKRARVGISLELALAASRHGPCFQPQHGRRRRQQAAGVPLLGIAALPAAGVEGPSYIHPASWRPSRRLREGTSSADAIRELHRC